MLVPTDPRDKRSSGLNIYRNLKVLYIVKLALYSINIPGLLVLFVLRRIIFHFLMQANRRSFASLRIIGRRLGLKPIKVGPEEFARVLR